MKEIIKIFKEMNVPFNRPVAKISGEKTIWLTMVSVKCFLSKKKRKITDVTLISPSEVCYNRNKTKGAVIFLN